MSKPNIEVFKFELKGREVIGLRYDRDHNIKSELDKRIRKSGKGISNASGWSQDHEAWYIDPFVWDQIRPSLVKRFNLIETEEDDSAELSLAEAKSDMSSDSDEEAADSLQAEDDEVDYVN